MSIIPSETPRLKHCTKCGLDLPATPDCFKRDKQRSDGLYPSCRSCANAAARARYNTPEVKALVREQRQRPEYKARVAAWGKEYRERPGVQERIRAYLADYNQRPEMKDQRRKYHATYLSKPGTRERVRAYQDRYYSDPANREKLQRYKQDYWRRAGKREHHHALTKAYYEATKGSPGHRAKVRTSNRNRRVHRRLVLGSHTTAQIREQLQRQRFRCYYAACGYSRFPIVGGKHVYHVEHTYPISRAAGTDIPANDIGYIVLACEPCNIKKHDKLPHEWPEGGRLL